jgi:hypothetical protein
MRAVVIRPDILIDCDESSLYKARVFQVGTGFGILGDRKKKSHPFGGGERVP